MLVVTLVAVAHQGTSMNALVVEALERATGRDLDQRADGRPLADG